ncbi:FUSC family protein [Marinicrinis lubricantis]|uniref:Aromatic acid exporter family protein n=1 Tax=Marinicrinis lubricantis TaxID=2086470 RepID=A0ABW1IJI8_9BACL
MRLGGRMLKTGLAVVLSLYICEWLELSPPLIMVIAAVLTTQPTIYRSFKYFIEQLQANTVGAVLGLVGVYLLGSHPVVTGLVVIIVIIVNLFLKLDSSIGLSILTVITVMDAPSGALNRFLLIMIGIVLAIVINALILPPNYDKTMLQRIKELNERISLLLRNMVEGVFDEKSFREEKERLQHELKKADDLYELLKEQTGWTKKKRRELSEKAVIYKYFLEVLHLEMKSLTSFRRDGKKQLETEIQDNIFALTQYYEMIFLKFEGNVKVKQSSTRNERVMVENEQLIEKLVSEGGLHVDSIRYLTVVATIMELSQELKRLDLLVSNYRDLKSPPSK